MSTTRKTVSIFWRESKQYPWRLACQFGLWPFGVALQDMVLPLIAAQAINLLVHSAQAGEMLGWATFVPYLVGFIIVGIAGQLTILASLLNIAKMQTLVRKNLENKVYQWLLSHSMNFHANSFSGALVTQANRFAAAYVQVSDVVDSTLNILTKFIVAIIVLALFSWPIALAIFLWTIFFIWVNVTLTKKRIKLTRIASEADSVLTAHLADSLSNVGVIKAFAREEDEAAAYGAKSSDRATKKYASWRKAVQNGAVTAGMMTTIQFVVLVLSINAIMNNQMQIGTLLLAQVYVAQLIGSLWNVSGLLRNLEQAFSDAAEMTDILGTPLEVQDAKTPKELRVKRPTIGFDHMHFTHNDANSDALFNDFDLHIGAGEKVGLVGHSGSGKTTLTRLLLRFADINKGKITIDGQDISEVSQADVRRHIAYVPQEPLLFHRSIAENIAYGHPGATHEQIVEAARQAHAAEFIEKLPNGYETLVGERGVKLSGGQRQRVAIARAILKDAPILVLDEATSALDSESEKLIQAALKKLMTGRTTIVIAHRLSTIQKMDRIVVLTNGRILEQGTHAELLAKNGTYADLWAHQSGGFIKD